MNFLNSYLKLGDEFYQRSQPTAVTHPQLLLWNAELARQLGVTENDPTALAEFFSGNRILSGAEAICMAYAGHQFGSFNPRLGDGRAHLLGDVVDDNGHSWDIQLKGSGPTPYSRGGDGRCAMGPAMREFIMSEAMTALGVPSTRCLAVVTTGEPVYRNTVSPGAVVTRVASSHLRVGSFEYFAARGDRDALQVLCDYAIARHYPQLQSEKQNKILCLLEKIIEQQIHLVTEWMRVGFIHGVMNTDNTAISGETIDYGPCAMMGIYNPNTVYSSIDHHGRYAFGNQANIAHWNMIRLAECLSLLVDECDTTTIAELKAILARFPEQFREQYNPMMARKLGIASIQDGDAKLIQAVLDQMALRQMDYTSTFDRLTQSLSHDGDEALLAAEMGECFFAWKTRIEAQGLEAEAIQALMRQHNPVVIPRNHHLEAVLAECEKSGDAHAAEVFLEVLRSPYQHLPGTAYYQTLPVDGDRDYRTFCGT